MTGDDVTRPFVQPYTFTKIDVPHLIDDDARYEWMLQAHQRICAPRAYINIVFVARNVGCMAFGIDVDILLTSKDSEIATARHKIMAFAHVATGANFNRIARAFGADHSSAMRSYQRYGSAIEAAVGGVGR